MQATVQPFFDPATWTWTYVVHAGVGTACAIVDPVLDYDPKSGRTRTDSAQQVVDYVRAQSLSVQWILETHAHADHLSAAIWLPLRAASCVLMVHNSPSSRCASVGRACGVPFVNRHQPDPP